MDPVLPRRRFVQAAGTGAALSVTGYTTLDEHNQDEESESDRADEVSESGIGLVVSPDDEELAELEQEIREQVEEGEISEMEAQMAFQERRAELVADTTEAFENELDEDDEIDVRDSIPEAGVLLVEGDAEALLALLDRDRVEALITAETYAEIEQQASDQPGDGMS